MEPTTLLIVIVGGAIATITLIKPAVRFVGTVKEHYHQSFFNLSFWLIVGSMVLAFLGWIFIDNQSTNTTLLWGLVALALANNIYRIDATNGFLFTLLQFLSIYLAILVWIAFAVFGGIREGMRKG